MQIYDNSPGYCITFWFFPGLRGNIHCNGSKKYSPQWKQKKLTAMETKEAKEYDMNFLNRISYDVIGESITVHSQLGPGLLESVYETCLAHQLLKKGYRVELQKPLPVIFNGEKLNAGFRLDILIEGVFIVEVKAVETLAPIHTAQLLTYLKLSGLKLGLLINFNVEHVRAGIKRIVNSHI